MVGKIRYWKCVDCNSMIDDKNMRGVRYSPRGTDAVYPRYMEFCGICCIYNPEVVIAYD